MRRKLKRRKKLVVKRDCLFCKEGQGLCWRDYLSLVNFLSPRSRILAGRRTGVCAKHQRQLTKVIKQARHLGLLPYVTKVK